MKTEILETMKKVRNEGDAVADLTVRLSSLAEASRNQKTLCILNSLILRPGKVDNQTFRIQRIERLNGSFMTIMGH